MDKTGHFLHPQTVIGSCVYGIYWSPEPFQSPGSRGLRLSLARMPLLPLTGSRQRVLIDARDRSQLAHLTWRLDDKGRPRRTVQKNGVASLLLNRKNLRRVRSEYQWLWKPARARTNNRTGYPGVIRDRQAASEPRSPSGASAPSGGRS